ncbi:MAG: YigZ family protein [Clostridia bacterium]|nr:YigZ family protein [Clostridia bacterium]
MYKLVKNQARTETVINKSRFIGTSFSCSSEEEARKIVEQIRKEFSDATHNCYAFIFDTLGNGMRYSDDGEPQGTAGLPILEVIKNKGLVNTGVVITRYFGGVKLGAGGLVRAYAGAAADVLNNSEIVEMCEGVIFNVIVDYTLSNVIEKSFGNALILSKEYSEVITYQLIVKKEQYQDLSSKITDFANGKVKIIKIKEEFYPF